MKLGLRIVLSNKVLSLRYFLFRGFESKSESRRFLLVPWLRFSQNVLELQNLENWKMENVFAVVTLQKMQQHF